MKVKLIINGEEVDEKTQVEVINDDPTKLSYSGTLKEVFNETWEMYSILRQSTKEKLSKIIGKKLKESIKKETDILKPKERKFKEGAFYKARIWSENVVLCYVGIDVHNRSEWKRFDGGTLTGWKEGNGFKIGKRIKFKD